MSHVTLISSILSYVQDKMVLAFVGIWFKLLGLKVQCVLENLINPNGLRF